MFKTKDLMAKFEIIIYWQLIPLKYAFSYISLFSSIFRLVILGMTIMILLLILGINWIYRFIILRRGNSRRLIIFNYICIIILVVVVAAAAVTHAIATIKALIVACFLSAIFSALNFATTKGMFHHFFFNGFLAKMNYILIIIISSIF